MFFFEIFFFFAILWLPLFLGLGHVAAADVKIVSNFMAFEKLMSHAGAKSMKVQDRCRNRTSQKRS